MAPLQIHDATIEVTEADLPEDRFSDHVNNARYFAFINQSFQGWYRAMGIRGGIPDRAAVMAHLSYDFLREVRPPGRVRVRLTATRAGRTSLEHSIEIHDLDVPPGEPPRLAGRGRAVHVWIDRSTGKSLPWPPELLARCLAPPDAG
jgi:acyl-CoA thioester hydrolase